jgi:hypothetical protein
MHGQLGMARARSLLLLFYSDGSAGPTYADRELGLYLLVMKKVLLLTSAAALSFALICFF